MASPRPSPPATAAEERAPSQEAKPETNGHSHDEPEVEKPALTEEPAIDTPKTNGTTNGSSEVQVDEVKTEEPSKDSHKPDDEPNAAELEVKKPTEISEPPPTSEDAEMKDAAPTSAALKDDAVGAKIEEVKEVEDVKPTEESKAVEGVVEKGAEDKVESKTEEDTPMGGVAPAETDAKPAASSEIDLGPTGMSQLALDGTEMDTSPITPSIETSQNDAPAKVAREREEDHLEEPPAKRAKTDSDDEKKMSAPAPKETASTPATIAAPPGTEDGLASIGFNDTSVDANKISSFQRREMRRAVQKAKKTKAGANFRDSVAKLWPALADTYKSIIADPIDLGEIDRNLRDNSKYATLGDVKKDLALIYTNTFQFNGPQHDVTSGALSVAKTVWADILAIPADEPQKAKAVPKQKPFREQRQSLSGPEAPRQSSGTPTSTHTPYQGTAKPKTPSAEARRDSLADADRPKRAVRAPKPKDIDYSTKASRKKLKPELQFCDHVLGELLHNDHWELNRWFRDPVDAVALGIPDYYNIVKKPMCLNKVSTMLGNGEITSVKDFDKNMKQIFENCYLFNGPPDQNPVSQIAKNLQNLYESRMKKKDKWLADFAKAHAPPSVASDDEDEEEEDDVEDTGASVEAAELNAQIQGMQKKLKDETDKLNELYAANAPDESMIEIQNNIVRMVQQTLLQKKSKLAEISSKLPKSKKSGKAAKPSKGNAPRKSSTAAPSKKAAPPKKAAPKKNLGPAEKDLIANAINDLDGNQLDRAIDIIKTDTGQNENPDGELELDIEQLSPEALSKLWALCKKSLANFGKDPNAPAPAPVRESAPPKGNSSSSKSKKNKPMSAQEQEDRIARLSELSSMYKRGSDAAEGMEVTQAPTPTHDSSDESSDSEEE